MKAVSKNLVKLKINHIEDSVFILYVTGRETPNDIDININILNQFMENLNESDLFLKKLIES